MKMSVSLEELVSLTEKQLEFFGGGSISNYLMAVLNRLNRCFSKVTNKYYHDEETGEAFFSPVQSAQYAQYLYFLSNEAFAAKDIHTAEKVYYLNKMMNSVDWFYEVELPEVFFADHALGSVLGRAKYANRFCIVQGCTVGQNHNIYPVFEENVTMHPMSIVIGASHVGRNVEISSNAFIRDEVIPDNCIVFGQSPNLKIFPKDEQEMRKRLGQFVYEDGG
jgi:serine O-acetyltransferase